MSLRQTIEADIKKAMLSKEKDTLRALRGIKSMILMAETEKNSSELTPDKEVALLMKASKQRKESAEIYEQQGRDDLKEKELLEVAVIEKYLPVQLSDEELEDKLRNIIETTGAQQPSDMGKVMGVATKELAGQADGKKISKTVKQLLSN